MRGRWLITLGAAAWVAACVAAAAACVDVTGLTCEGSDCLAAPPDGAVPTDDGASDASNDGVTDGTAPSDSGDAGRVNTGLLALYTFDEASGTTARDTSGVTPALDLDITSDAGGATTWGSGSLKITSPSLLVSSGPATKITTRCMTTHEVTLETWITPANTTQDLARIVGIAPGIGVANISVRAEVSAYVAYTTDVKFAGPSGSVKTALTHVVVTKSASNSRTLYVDAVPVALDSLGDDLSTWKTAYPMTIARASDGTSPWLGTVHLVAVYDRALTAGEVEQNFAAGP